MQSPNSNRELVPIVQMVLLRISVSQTPYLFHFEYWCYIRTAHQVLTNPRTIIRVLQDGL